MGGGYFKMFKIVVIVGRTSRFAIKNSFNNWLKHMDVLLNQA
jgi:hypothetical protein